MLELLRKFLDLRQRVQDLKAAALPTAVKDVLAKVDIELRDAAALYEKDPLAK